MKETKIKDTTYNDFKRFQGFIYRHFKDLEHYFKMRPVSNQPDSLCETAKTHKF